MSALGHNDRKDLADILHFAPPRARSFADESTIRPVLERLSRGENQDDSITAIAKPLLQDTPIIAQASPRAPKIPITMAGRLALAMGLVAALAIPAVAFLRPRAEPPPSSTVPVIPKKPPAIKKVHTISFQAEKPTGPKLDSDSVPKQSTSAVEQPAPPPPAGPGSAAARQEASASDGAIFASTGPVRSHTEGALALTAPLELWAKFPGGPASAGWRPPVGPSKTNSAEKDAVEHAAPIPHRDRATATRRGRHHARSARRNGRHYRRRRSVRRPAAPVSQLAQQTAQAADSQAATTAATKPNPIQAVINAILGKNSGEPQSAAASPHAPLRQ
jgi:hypothetical protein